MQPVGFSGSTPDDVQQASRYAIALVASVVYRKVGQKEPLWSNEAFSQRDEYDMGEQRRQLLRPRGRSRSMRLAEAFARSLVAAMLEAF